MEISWLLDLRVLWIRLDSPHWLLDFNVKKEMVNYNLSKIFLVPYEKILSEYVFLFSRWLSSDNTNFEVCTRSTDSGSIRNCARVLRAGENPFSYNVPESDTPFDVGFRSCIYGPLNSY